MKLWRLAPNISAYFHTFYVSSVKYNCWEIKLKNKKTTHNPGLLDVMQHCWEIPGISKNMLPSPSKV